MKTKWFRVAICLVLSVVLFFGNVPISHVAAMSVMSEEELQTGGQLGSGTPDGTPPVLLGIELSSDTVTVPGTLEVTVDATDDVSGLDCAWVYFYCEETGKTLSCYLDHEYYDKQTGKYVRYEDGKLHGTLKIDQYVETGTFVIHDIRINDIAGNRVGYDVYMEEDYPPYDFRMPEELKTLQFDVIESDTPDGTPPVLRSVEISRDRVTAPGMLEVTVDATDDVSGLDEAWVYFFCEETRKTLSCYLDHGYYDKQTGKYVRYEDGKLHGTLKIDQYVETGTFVIQDIRINDIAGNSVSYDMYIDEAYPPCNFPLPDALKQKSLYVINTVPDVTTSVSKPEFVEQIEQAEDGSYIVADFSSDSTLPEEVFDAIAGTDKTLELTSEGITWRFSGVDIVNQTKPIDLAVEITKAEETQTNAGQAIQEALEETPGIVMKFAENGELPGEATIQIKVDYAMRQYLGQSQQLCIYYYNNQSGEMELVAENLQVIDDTYVEFSITHCSYYVLTTRLPENEEGLIASGKCGDNLTWKLDADGVLTISGTGDMYDYEYNDNRAQPWNDFSDQIVKVIVEAGVTSIGEHAIFFMNSLITVELPTTLNRIGAMALSWNDNMESVTFRGPVPVIDDYAFMDTGASVLDGTQCYYPAGDSSWDNFVNRWWVTWVPVGSSGDSEEEPVDGYLAGITAAEEVVGGDRILALLKVNHSEDTHFAAGEMIVRYDGAALTFNPNASNLGTTTVKDTGNAIILEDYGADKDFANTAYVLAFDTKIVGTTELVLESAAFVNKENAAKSDLIAATIRPASAVVRISKLQFAVELDSIFKGPAKATDGETYTFYASDSKHYQYDGVSATSNGNPVAVVDHGDGSYSVEKVTGPLVITGNRSEKTFKVTFEGNGAEGVVTNTMNAVYGREYVFSLPKEEGVVYSVDGITIDGKAYTGYYVTGTTYTIDGMDIHGDLVITVSKVQTKVSVSVEGTGAGAAEGYEKTLELGKDYTLTLTPEAGYVYTVTATVDGEPVTVIDNGDNTYTVEKVKGDLVFTVDKTMVTDGVFFTQYLKVNHTNVWLIQYTGDVAQGKVPTYDGNNMYWSDDYQAYCYLVIAEVLLEDDVKAKIGITDGEAEVIANTMDVNGSGRVDASDAQLVYNMYNAMYTEFGGDITAEKFFYADVNKDGQINVQDAAAIIHQILN